MELSGRRSHSTKLPPLRMARIGANRGFVGARILASRKVIHDIVAAHALFMCQHRLRETCGRADSSRRNRRAPIESRSKSRLWIGLPLSEPEVRAMMLLRANVLALGFQRHSSRGD